MAEISLTSDEFRIGSYFHDSVTAAVDQAVEEAKDACIRKAMNNFRTQLADKLSKTSLDISSFVSVEKIGGNIRIEVKLPENQK